MPIYIDRHDVPGASPEAVADAHRLDVAVQEKHGVQYHTYWFDRDHGLVFCLAEGPNREALEAVHRESTGLVAGTIVEVDDSAPINAFLGSAPDHPVGVAYTASAMRAIVFTDVAFGRADSTTR